MGIPSNIGAWEISMSQEASFAIKGCTVAVETLSKQDHDVSLLLMTLPDVGIGYFSEAQWCGTLPYSEGLPNGLECGILAHLGGVILDATSRHEGREGKR